MGPMISKTRLLRQQRIAKQRRSQEDYLKVLHSRRRSRERADDSKPLGKQWPLPESYGVVYQRIPGDFQNVAIGGFDAAVHLGTLIPLGACGHRFDTSLSGFFKGRVLGRANAYVGEFNNHGLSLTFFNW